MIFKIKKTNARARKARFFLGLGGEETTVEKKQQGKKGRLNLKQVEEVEQEVFEYKKMTERGVEANFDITNELKNYFLKE